MARIAGVNIPQTKVVHVALTYIYGIGKKFSNDICTKLNISKNKKNYYSINVSNIIDKVLKNEKKIYHLNFSKLIFDGKIFCLLHFIVTQTLSPLIIDFSWKKTG